MKDWFVRLAKMPVRFWLQVAVVILSIIPIAYICMRMSSSPEYPLALTFVFLAIASKEKKTNEKDQIAVVVLRLPHGTVPFRTDLLRRR